MSALWGYIMLCDSHGKTWSIRIILSWPVSLLLNQVINRWSLCLSASGYVSENEEVAGDVIILMKIFPKLKQRFMSDKSVSFFTLFYIQDHPDKLIALQKYSCSLSCSVFFSPVITVTIFSDFHFIKLWSYVFVSTFKVWLLLYVGLPHKMPIKYI